MHNLDNLNRTVELIVYNNTQISRKLGSFHIRCLHNYVKFKSSKYQKHLFRSKIVG